MFRDKLTAIIDAILMLIPYGSIIAVAIFTAYLLIAERYTLLITALVILIPILIVSLLLIINRKTIQQKIILGSEKKYLLNTSPRIMKKIYLIVYFITIIIALLTQEFTTPFLLLTIGLYGITIIQIFSKHSERDRNTIVIELFATSILFALVTFCSHEFIIASSDPIYHMLKTESILDIGHIPPDFGPYTQFPGLHLLAASTTLLTNLSVYSSGFLPQIVFSLISGIFVYYLSLDITHNRLISELAILFYFLLPGTWFATVNFYPSAQAGICFIILMYLFLRNDTNIQTKVRLVLSGIFLLQLITVHHATAILLLAVFTFILFSFWIYKVKLSRWQIIFTCMFYGFVLSKFLYNYLSTGIAILKTYLIVPTLSGESATIEISAEAQEAVNVTFMINTAISAIICLLVYFAIYFLISKRKIKNFERMKSFLPLLSLIFIFILPNISPYIPILSTLGETFGSRFQVYFNPLVGIFMGLGGVVLFSLLISKLNSKRVPAILCIVLCLICVVVGPLVASNGASTYSILGKDIYYPNDRYFTTSEVTSFLIVPTLLPVNSKMFTDRHSYRFIGEQSSNLDVDDIGLLFSENSPNTPRYVLFRNTHYLNSNEGKIVFIDITRNNTTYHYFLKNIYEDRIVYSNGDVILYSQ